MMVTVLKASACGMQQRFRRPCAQSSRCGCVLGLHGRMRGNDCAMSYSVAPSNFVLMQGMTGGRRSTADIQFVIVCEEEDPEAYHVELE